jgi:hypothetical protein
VQERIVNRYRQEWRQPGNWVAGVLLVLSFTALVIIWCAHAIDGMEMP